ncbi:potassium voltage-gated channel subfamily V member 2-like [Protopterus annectens]|uniref:potassium voltage-gated channel subfamily V member 2-like n=1 Tax=Protopterus annectens TaxID=7888 RepID=UPI001CFBFAF1|nr:potassium voltage-gated channel subfamily V member 2-like [Protopterus annectens]
MRRLVKRQSSLFANLKLGENLKLSQTVEEDAHSYPFAQDSSVKQWYSTHDVGQSGKHEEHVRGEEGSSPPVAKQKQGVLSINVGGKSFGIAYKAVAHYSKTRLGKLATCSDPVKKLEFCDDYSVLTNEYFFDRDPYIFYHIFHFYRSGVLWIMDGLCPENFMEEISYWEIPIKYSQKCCRILLQERQDEVNEWVKIQRELQAELEPLEKEEHFEGKYLGELRKKIWNLVENPYSSIPAKVIAILSSLCVLISTVAMSLNTVEELHYKSASGKTYMEHVEVLCIVFFTIEYLLRLLSTADVTKFLKTALNTVDLIAILPFYVQVIFEYFAGGSDSHYQEDIHKMESVGQLSKVLKIIRLTRIFRILKLARHSIGLRAFGFTLRQSYQQVCCLLLFIAMGVFTFSALMHSVEHDVPGTNFTSIPDTWWWAAVSISTVGYGDTVPGTLLGRVVAFLCISFGIILNGMPISILYGKFSDYYIKLKSHRPTKNSDRNEIRLKQRALQKCIDCCRGQDRN